MNVRCFIEAAIRSSSRFSRPSKIGTFLSSSTVPCAMRRFYDTDLEDEDHGSRLLAGLAEPRRGAIGIPRPWLGKASAGLRPRRPSASPRGGGLARGRGDRDHALPPRPLGRPGAVDVGRPVWAW